jgi:hypothetical protein
VKHSYALLALSGWLLGTSCGSPENPEVRRATELLEKPQRCKSLIARHELALARVFEIEMHSSDLQSDWYKTAVAIHTRIFDIEGHLRDPSEVVHDVLSTMAQEGDGDERRRQEYVLLGAAMPLEARREFEAFCVVAEP